MHRSPLADSSGFSLAETLVAVAVLAAGLLSLAQLFVVSAAVLRRANDLSMASMLAAQKLEELRSVATASSGAIADGVEFVGRAGVAAGATDAAARMAASYTREWSIRALPSNPDVSIVHVRVTPGGLIDGTPIAERTPRQAGEVTLVALYARPRP